MEPDFPPSEKIPILRECIGNRKKGRFECRALHHAAAQGPPCARRPLRGPQSSGSSAREAVSVGLPRNEEVERAAKNIAQETASHARTKMVVASTAVRMWRHSAVPPTGAGDGRRAVVLTRARSGGSADRAGGDELFFGGLATRSFAGGLVIRLFSAELLWVYVSGPDVFGREPKPLDQRSAW
jgi:hypothetical protein